jgi:hypothetical protein
MINHENTIPCPVCGTKIPFEIQALLAGTSFNCPNAECYSAIGLAPESAPIVKQTIEKLESIKTTSKQKI